MLLLLLDQAPPPAPSVRLRVAPEHNEDAPDMEPAEAGLLTVTVNTAYEDPQLLETV